MFPSTHFVGEAIALSLAQQQQRALLFFENQQRQKESRVLEYIM